MWFAESEPGVAAALSASLPIWLPGRFPNELGKRSAAARADARAEQAGKPRFAAPVPPRGEVTATPRLKMDLFNRKILQSQAEYD